MALPVVRSISAPQLTRRSILQGMVALPALAVAAAPRMSFGQATALPTAKWAKQIGIELYTVRDLMERDFEGTLAKLAALGERSRGGLIAVSRRGRPGIGAATQVFVPRSQVFPGRVAYVTIQ